jgi:hypothetical protein
MPLAEFAGRPEKLVELAAQAQRDVRRQQ